jgi:hypothetical protein
MSRMTLGNMRAIGVRTLAIWCSGCGCNHQGVLDLSSYADGIAVQSFGGGARYRSGCAVESEWATGGVQTQRSSAAVMMSG